MSIIPDLEVSPYDSIVTEQIAVEGVEKLLNDLQSSKAHGPDEIPAHLLKQTASSMSPRLTLVFNASLHRHRLPSDWKTARVTPILKKGSCTSTTNYRPVSSMSIPCKIFEQKLYSSIYKHLDTNTILCDAQHRFRKKRSCETQLITTIHDIATHFNSGDLLFLDFSKVFDKVPHAWLLHKLDYYGTEGLI